MNVPQQIENFISTLIEPNRSEFELLHQRIQNLLPHSKLWFDLGLNEENKVVTNPTIGYGLFTIHYANGSTKEFFQIGLSANKTGISIYILGIKDKKFLIETYGEKIGKAKVTGYCIRFKKLKDIDLAVLDDAILNGVELSKNN